MRDERVLLFTSHLLLVTRYLLKQKPRRSPFSFVEAIAAGEEG